MIDQHTKQAAKGAAWRTVQFLGVCALFAAIWIIIDTRGFTKPPAWSQIWAGHLAAPSAY